MPRRGAGRAERVTGELRAPDGTGLVSSNLVVRYAGPGELLGSGHPEGAGSGLPENLGLIRSGDGGDSWEPVAAFGEADFHLLQARGDRVVAVRADAADIEISNDGGNSFQTRTAPEAPVDGGESWKDRGNVGLPVNELAADGDGMLYASVPGGEVHRSTDGGATWKRLLRLQ